MFYIDNKILSHNELSLYLINKYLPKFFSEKTIKKLKRKYHPEILAKLIGEKSISFFSLYFLRDYFIPSDINDLRQLSETHFEIWEELDRMFIKDLYDYELFKLPRGMGKTTIINKCLSTWCVCYEKSRYLVVIANKDTDSQNFIAGTKEMLTSTEIENGFGKLIIKGKDKTVNKNKIVTMNDCCIVGMSSGSSVRGTTFSSHEHGEIRPTLILLDDIISEDDILTDNAKEKIVTKFYSEILESGDSPVFRDGRKIKQGTKFLVLGTPLQEGDFITTLEEDSTFHEFARPMMPDDPDKLFNTKLWQEFKNILFDKSLFDAKQFYNKHIDEMKYKTIWEEKYHCPEYASKYFTKRLSFMCELMVDSANIGDKLVKTMNIQYLEDYPKLDDKYVILSIDQAATTSKRSDFTAYTVLQKKGIKYYIQCGDLQKFDSRVEFDKYITYTINLIKEWKVNYVILERNVFKGVDTSRIQQAIQEDEELRHRHIEVFDVYNNKNKDARISTILERINNGLVVFNKQNKLYNEQVKSFAGANYTLHDDAIDSLEGAINSIDEITKKKAKIHVCSKKDIFE